MRPPFFFSRQKAPWGCSGESSSPRWSLVVGHGGSFQGGVFFGVHLIGFTKNRCASVSVHLYIYDYIYDYMCVCVCYNVLYISVIESFSPLRLDLGWSSGTIFSVYLCSPGHNVSWGWLPAIHLSSCPNFRRVLHCQRFQCRVSIYFN